MKVLQVNCVYKNGSTGKIVNDIHTELMKQGIESIVCYGRGDEVSEKFVYKICKELYSNINHFISNVTGVTYGGCRFSTRKLIRIIENEKPNIVHLQCINGYFVNIYHFVKWLKKNRIKTVVTLHAEFMYTGGCGHSLNCNQWNTFTGCGFLQKCPRWRVETKSFFFDRTRTMWKRMKKTFEDFDSDLIITSVSPWLMERAKSSPILRGKEHQVVLNGLDTKVFHFRENDNLRKKYIMNNEKILFHATPFFSLEQGHIKGGYYINELAKRFTGEKIKFIVAGTYPEGIQVEENVILLGKVIDQKLLAQYYSIADLTLLTSERETFSMITAESLCCGTPVVGFKAGGPEQIALEEYSSFVEYKDLDALEKSIKEMLLKKIDKAEICRKAIVKFGKDVMCKSYIEIYKKLYSK